MQPPLDKTATTEHFCLGNTPVEERSKKFIRYPSTISEEENHASEPDTRTIEYNRARSLPRRDIERAGIIRMK